MIILQAGIARGQFYLWGEISAPVPEARTKKRSATDPVEPHPFDAGAAHLVKALMDSLPIRSLPGGVSDPPVIWLPTAKGCPIPSQPLIADVPAGSRVALEPWQITVIALPSAMVIDLLSACQGKEMLGQGLLVGSTLAYWARLLRFAGALVAREQIVPGLKKRERGWYAIWQPVITGADGGRLAELVRGMPHACRALSHDKAVPPETSPAEIAQEFVSATVDNLVRLAISKPRDPGARGGRVVVASFPSVHDHWAHALALSQDGLFGGEEAELEELAQQVKAWQRPIAVSSEAPFALCFRMEEPAEDASPNAPWRVRYLLQARDDPSLFLPVAEAWKEKSKAAQILRKRSFQPREYLLTALGQAAAFSPQIEKSLKSAVPSEFVTDASHAYEFLTQGCWMLEQAGFTILLPSWWTRKGGKHRLSAQAVVQSPTQTSGQGMSLGQMLDFDWKIALGSEEMSLEELLELARAKMPLVKVRGQWVQVRADDLQAAIALLERERAGKATLRDIVQMSLGGGEAPGGLPFAGVKASGWIAEFLSQLEGQGAFTELPPPPGFQGTLRPYQIRGYSWLSFLRQWGLGACLADDMGLGKTIQTLAMLQRDWMTNQKPCLLICPTSVVANWKKEAERFTPDLPVLIHHGGRRTKGDAFSSQVKKVALVLSSYSLLHRDRDLFDQVKWSGIILDEAQNVKNPQTKQSLAARSLRADYRLALTGTPVENHVGDLWAILEFLNPGWLGSQSDFRKRYFIPIQAQQDAEAALHLRRLTNPFILRRLKTDKTIIADLPEKLEMKVYCNLTREQATLYQSVVDDLNQSLDDVDGIKRKGIILATLTKLKQVCNHPLQFLGDQSAIPGRSGKLARLTEMLEEMLESEERALIFTQFTEMGEILKKHLQETFGKEVLFLHGGVARESRVRMVDRFQNEAEGPRLFLLSLKAGGTGLNLTRATHVFHFDRWWNPAVENQATDRAFRIGQDKMVQVHKFICAGTVEDRIDEMIERKEAVASRVVAAREDWLTEMSNDQLRDLFKLRQEAIGD